jgi:hypothetical protein
LEPLNPGTTRPTEPQIAGKLKAIPGGIRSFFFEAGFAATKAIAVAANAACENGGELLETLIGGQF